MILDKLVLTNLLVPNTNPHHSFESAVSSALIAGVSVLLFLFWRKRQALLNFQSWALLMTVINLIFFFHFSPLGPHIIVKELEYQFTSFAMAFLRFLEFLTSAITIWRLWKLSEVYIPHEILYGSAKKAIEKPTEKKLLARSLALWHTVKNGGNHEKDQKRVKKDIKKRILSS